MQPPPPTSTPTDTLFPSTTLFRSIDLKQSSTVQTSMAKLFVADKIVEIVLTCQRVLGAYGYSKGFTMEQLIRDALAIPIFGGSSAIQKGNIEIGRAHV